MDEDSLPGAIDGTATLDDKVEEEKISNLERDNRDIVDDNTS